MAHQEGSVADDPALDATDGAHPAWWRGHDRATEAWRERVATAERERDMALADNTALRTELDDLRGRLARTATRLADLERASAAMDFDATLATLRRVPVRQWCGRCAEERTRWCVGCGYCETTCCTCPGGLDANGSEVPCG